MDYECIHQLTGEIIELDKIIALTSKNDCTITIRATSGTVECQNLTAFKSDLTLLCENRKAAILNYLKQLIK